MNELWNTERPLHERAKALAEHSVRVRDKLLFRDAKIVEFNNDDFVEIEFTRDDGTRDMAIFQRRSWTGVTDESVAELNAHFRRSPPDSDR